MDVTVPAVALALDFDKMRPMFRGHLTQQQVDGINAILTGFSSYGDADKRHLAYLLATAKHETWDTMWPIAEVGSPAYFKRYEPTTPAGHAVGNTQSGDGFLYRGRGFVQITGRANYAKFGIEGDPNDALDPEVAARILVQGCIRGMFTGKKLSDYSDFVNMRRTVNGLDRADLIATYANTFLGALS